MTETLQIQSDSGAPQLTVPQAIANLTQTQDVGDRYYAAWWLGRFEVKAPEAIAALLIALKDQRDRSEDGGFPLRRNAARALGKLGDLSVVPDLIVCLDCTDYYVREAAAQSLGSLGAQAGRDPLLALLEGGVKAAVAVPGKPHLVQPYNAILEALGQLAEGSSDSSKLIAAIEPFLDHAVPQVKNAAARAMYQLTGNGHYVQVLIKTLICDDLQLRRSALLDLGEVGYLPAAGAIANTLAENSIKLISLKGLLEKELCNSEPGIWDRALDPTVVDPAILENNVSESACQVMALMDSLL